MNTLFQKRRSRQRLVEAAAAEKLTSTPSASKGIPWDLIRNLRNKSSSQDTIISDDSTCEARDPQESGNFVGRFNITVSNKVDNSGKLEPEKKFKSKSFAEKSVRFHRYDEVIYDNRTDYEYSRHEREVEEEANRDLVDNLEEMMGDFGYFFRCLKDGIAEEASNRFINADIIAAKESARLAELRKRIHQDEHDDVTCVGHDEIKIHTIEEGVDEEDTLEETDDGSFTEETDDRSMVEYSDEDDTLVELSDDDTLDTYEDLNY